MFVYISVKVGMYKLHTILYHTPLSYPIQIDNPNLIFKIEVAWPYEAWELCGTCGIIGVKEGIIQILYL